MLDLILVAGCIREEKQHVLEDTLYMGNSALASDNGSVLTSKQWVPGGVSIIPTTLSGNKGVSILTAANCGFEAQKCFCVHAIPCNMLH
jgi:hypothetical protein